MRGAFHKHFTITMGIVLLSSTLFIIVPSEQTLAGEYDGSDLAIAILANQSTLLYSHYEDKDRSGTRQGTVLSSLGIIIPTDGSTFAILSTGTAGSVPVTTNGYNPGDERGTWFRNRYGRPRDWAELTMTLQVPTYMHYLYYDIQFFSAEYPEYVGTQYNDKLTITVDSPSQGETEYVIDVNSGDFVLNANDLPGTGFDIFATSGNPGSADWVDTTPRSPGADAGATALVTREHPVSPHEQVTITFKIRDTGDNLFDSAAFIDNVMFSGYAKTEIMARKTLQDLNGALLECNDTIRYSITISNIGTADQSDNPGNEFEDFIPNNTTYVLGSASATSGIVEYELSENKIVWNGGIPSESSVALFFNVTVDEGLVNEALISNQGIVYWDSDEDEINDAIEYTDDPAVDDGIDLDGDGETDDDDPTNITVFSYELPSVLTEDFSDDIPGGNATQSYYLTRWFETSEASIDSNFEVASSYHYSTVKSFKTKLRSSNDPQYWYYNLSDLLCDMEWWEVWFACGNASEPYDFCLDFKNTDENDIAKIKFEYEHMGTEIPTDYVLNLYYWQPVSGWIQLNSDYLFNGWYKLRIEKNSSTNIDYSLYSARDSNYYNATGDKLSSPFSNFAHIEWGSTKDPVVCPMFFWDEHSIGLIDI